MYSTNIVVIVPIICLYITVVVVVISFSIIVSCIFISLLLVTVVIVYSKIGSNINVIISILFDGENISFEASLASTCFEDIVLETCRGIIIKQDFVHQFG